MTFVNLCSMIVVCSPLIWLEMLPQSTSDNANFADNWHKWHKKRSAIAEIAREASLWDAIYAIPVIFRNLAPFF
jgi:hypothetical protein